jgi:hypothetical protein
LTPSNLPKVAGVGVEGVIFTLLIDCMRIGGERKRHKRPLSVGTVSGTRSGSSLAPTYSADEGPVKRSRRSARGQWHSAGEIAALRALPSSLQREAFFTCWTRKEAYIKARGLGLSLPLDQFDVSLAPGEPPALLNTRWDPAEASRWSLCAIAVAPDYAATLAVEGNGWRLRCWEWMGVRRERPS